MTRFENEVNAEIEGLEARLSRLYAEKEQVQKFPTEPKDGSVVKFTVQFEDYQPVYRYAAYRIGNGWYVTGGKHLGRVLRWYDLVDLMRKDIRYVDPKAKLTYQVSDKWKTVG